MIDLLNFIGLKTKLKKKKILLKFLIREKYKHSSPVQTCKNNESWCISAWLFIN